MFLTAVLTGLRQGEILGLRWSDLDLAADTISVQQTLETAGRNPRFGKPKTSRSRASPPCHRS